jgi:hypothetical protein
MEKLLLQYEFSFERAICHEFVRFTFRQHVLRQMNSEPAEFIEAVCQFQNILDVSERYRKAVDIWETHLDQKSPRQVNIPGIVFRDVQQKIKQCTQTKCDVNTFESAFKDQVRDIGHEWFSDFINNNIAFHIQALRYENLLDEIGTTKKKGRSKSFFGSPTLSPEARENLWKKKIFELAESKKTQFITVREIAEKGPVKTTEVRSKAFGDPRVSMVLDLY